MTPRERAEASVLVRQQGPRVVDVQSDTHIVLMRSYSVLDAEVRAGWLRDMVERAILADRAERDAGEAERVREAVARAVAERDVRWFDAVEHYAGPVRACDCAVDVDADFRARATSPALAAHPADRAATDAAKAARARGEDVYADGEGRCEVVPEPVAAERAERCSACGRPTTVGEEFGGPCVYASDAACAERAVVEAAEARMREAVDALAAARKGG